MRNTSIIVSVAAALAAAAPAPAQDEHEARHPLQVVFVGDGEGVRRDAYVGFLREHFARVTSVARESCKPADLRDADVVLLDWSQQDGVIAWMNDAEAKEKRECPLGPRADWETPTVLLGSAGLNVACAWDVRGGSG
jgi:hypothetical protein